MKFKKYYVNNDVWIKASHNSKKEEVYDYTCIYVDDVLVISCKPEQYLDAIGGKVNLKPGSVGIPKTYLGTNIKKRTDVDNEDSYWLLDSNSYLMETFHIVTEILDESETKV